LVDGMKVTDLQAMEDPGIFQEFSLVAFSILCMMSRGKRHALGNPNYA